MPNIGRPSRDCHLCRKRRVKVGDIQLIVMLPTLPIYITQPTYTASLASKYGGMVHLLSISSESGSTAVYLYVPCLSSLQDSLFSTLDLLHVPVYTYLHAPME